MHRRTRWIRRGGLVFLFSVALPFVLLLASGLHGLKGFPLDDAWIHMVYGRSVARWGYLAYNEGLPASGSTSPLWAYVLGLIHLTFSKTDSIVFVVKLTGIFFHGLMAWAVFRILKKITASDVTAVLGGLIIGIAPEFVVSSISGMEVSLGCALCLLAFDRYSENSFLAAGLLLGLCGLTRPEFGVIAVLLFGDMALRLLKKEIQWRDMLQFVAAVAVAGFCFLGWNQYVSGRPLPSTFYVKSRFFAHFPFVDRVRAGFKMITAEAPLAGGVAWIGLLGLVFLKKPGRRLSCLLFLSALIYGLTQIAIIAPVDENAFYHIRYLLPAILLFWIPLGAGVWAVVMYLSTRMKGHGERLLGNILAASLVGVVVLAMAFFLIVGNIRWGPKYANDCRNIDELQVEIGRSIDRAFPQTARIGTVDAGAVRYFGKRYTVDLVGLNTPDVFYSPPVPLDALVLMPAWIQLPHGHNLETVCLRRTRGYEVTSNPSMDTQVVMVCPEGASACRVSFQLLGRTTSVSLSGVTERQINELRKKMARGKPDDQARRQ
jgi:hypothetical protein